MFAIDFVADGPHGLVGGTTGSGKSELLRTLVAGLAASVDPDHLTFVLIDFKGGSAFDECARLPHTVGMVTDLDEHLAERALRCLEAELRHRERALREPGAVDLPDYLRKGLPEPLPRLLVIIDEFATLKAELPDFVDALVGVAQRGRSLGVHLVLATQRPPGAVSDNIRANTNLRIALRVQETPTPPTSSTSPTPPASPAPPRAGPTCGWDRARWWRSRRPCPPARAGRRRWPRWTWRRSCTGRRRGRPQFHARPTLPAGTRCPGRRRRPHGRRYGSVGAGRSDQGRVRPDGTPGSPPALAGSPSRRRRPRRADRPVADAGTRRPPEFVPLALADDPDAQTQYPMGWSAADGNLIVYGIGGSGTTTTLSSLALSLARLLPGRRRPPLRRRLRGGGVGRARAAAARRRGDPGQRARAPDPPDPPPTRRARPPSAAG